MNEFENNFDKAIDPWKGFEHIQGINNSKLSILNTYKKIIYFPLLPFFSLKRKSDIVVIGMSNYVKMSEEFKSISHVIMRPRDLIRYPRDNLKILNNFSMDFALYKKIYLQLINNKNFQYNYILDILKIVSPKILIVGSTIDPVQRLWIFFAKKLKIKILCIQHGVFSSLSAPNVLESNITDYYYSFCPKQSKLIENIIPISKHRHLYSEERFIYKKKYNTTTICLIGTDHERYGSKGKQNKEAIINIYKRLIRVIKKNRDIKFKILYKKHPSEEWIGNLKKHVLLTKNVNSKNVDIFFGVASTMLIKLASNRKCTIQLASADFIQDRYENYSFCKTVDIEKIEENGINFLVQNEIEIPCLKENNFNELLKNTIDEIFYNNNLRR